MKTDKLLLWLVVIAVALYVLQQAGVFSVAGAGAGGNGGGAICGLAVAQNLQKNTIDYSTSAEVAGANSTVYGPDGTAIKSNLADSTNQPTNYGQSYTFYSTKTGYFNAIDKYTTPCDQVSPSKTIKMAVLQEPDITFINSDGLTSNNASDQVLGEGDAKTVTMRISGNTAKAYMTDPTCNGGQFVVGLEFDDYSEIDGANTGIIGCTKTSVPSDDASYAQIAFLCNGNVFNYDQKDWKLTIAMKPGIAPAGAEDVYADIYPVTNTLSSTSAGSKPLACVVENDAGTAAGDEFYGVLYINNSTET